MMNMATVLRFVQTSVAASLFGAALLAEPAPAASQPAADTAPPASTSAPAPPPLVGAVGFGWG